MANTQLYISDEALLSLANDLKRSDLNTSLIKSFYTPGETYTYKDNLGNDVDYTIPADWGVYPAAGNQFNSAIFLTNILTNTTRIYYNTQAEANPTSYTNAASSAVYTYQSKFGSYRDLDENTDPLEMVNFYKAVQKECIKVILFIHKYYDLGEFVRSAPTITTVDGKYTFSTTESYITAQFCYNYKDTSYNPFTDLTKIILSILDVELHQVTEIISVTLFYIHGYLFQFNGVGNNHNIQTFGNVYYSAYSDFKSMFTPDIFSIVGKDSNQIINVLSQIYLNDTIKRFSTNTDPVIVERRKQLSFLAFNLIQKEFRAGLNDNDLDYIYPLGIYEYRLTESPAYDFYIKSLSNYKLTALPFIINDLINDPAIDIKSKYANRILLINNNNTFNYIGNAEITKSANNSFIPTFSANTNNISNFGTVANRVYYKTAFIHKIYEDVDALGFLTVESSSNYSKYQSYAVKNGVNPYLTDDVKRAEFINLYEDTVSFVQGDGVTLYGFSESAKQLSIERTPKLLNINKFHIHSFNELDSLIQLSQIIDDYKTANGILNNSAYFQGLYTLINDPLANDLGLGPDLAKLQEYLKYFEMFFRVRYLILNDVSEVYYYNPLSQDDIEYSKEIIKSYPIYTHWYSAVLNNDSEVNAIITSLNTVETRENLLNTFKNSYDAMFASHLANNKYTLISGSGGSDVETFKNKISKELESAKYNGDRVLFTTRTHLELLFYIIYDLEIYVTNYVVPIFTLRDSVHQYVFNTPNLDFYINEINALISNSTGVLKQYLQKYNLSGNLESNDMIDFNYLFNQYIVYSNINRNPLLNRIKYTSYSNVINKINIDTGIKTALNNFNPIISTASDYTSIIRNQIANNIIGDELLKNYLISFNYLFSSYLNTLLFDTIHEETKRDLNKLIKSYPDFLTKIQNNISTNALVARIREIELGDPLNNYGLTNLFNGNESGLSLITKSIKFKRFDTIANNTIKFRSEIIDEIYAIINENIDDTEFLRIQNNEFYYDKIYQALSSIESIKKYRIEHINMAIDKKFKANADLLTWKVTLESQLNSNQTLTDMILGNRPLVSDYQDIIDFIYENRNTNEFNVIYETSHQNLNEFINVLNVFRSKLNQLSYQEICKDLYAIEVFNGKTFESKTLPQITSLLKNYIASVSRNGKIVRTSNHVDFFIYKIFKLYSELKDIKDRNPNAITIMDKTISNINFKINKKVSNSGKFY